MDRHSDIDNFEGLLRERSEEFKMYPTKRVWHSIYNNIHPGKKWPSIAMCIVLISTLLLIGFLNTNDTVNTASTEKNSTVTIANLSNFQNVESSFANFESYLNNDNKNFQLNNYYPNIQPATGVSNKAYSSLISKIPVSQTGLNYLKASKKQAGSFTRPADKKAPNFLISLPISDGNFDGIPTISNPNAATLSASKVSLNDDINLPLNASLKKLTTIQLNQIGINENQSASESQSEAENQNTISNLKDGKIIIYNNDLLNLIEVSESVPTQKKIKDIVKGTLKNINKEDSYKPLVLSTTDKAWVEDYALHNRPIPKKWAGKLAWQFYVTPSVVYRTLKNYMPGEQNINKQVVQHPSMGLEFGTGIIYPIFKGVKFKTGLQLNYTRYNTEGFENSHPISTSINLNDVPGGYYAASRTTPYSNYGGITPVILHNETYQISLPVGLEFKLAGNDNLQWNIASTIQPSYIFGGQSYLISADQRNFIKESSLLNRWNLNVGFETFISYKLDGFTLQLGPQFRKQIFTTNSKVYTVQEKLVNYGLKIGITKLIK